MSWWVGGPCSRRLGSLQAVPNAEYEPSRRFRATFTEEVTLPDGTEAEHHYLEPDTELANYSPRWEGSFARDGYTYTLWTSIDQNGGEITKQALFTMAEVEERAREARA